MSRVKVNLCRKELLDCRMVARGINAKESMFGAMNYDDKQSVETHFIGLVAEMAVAKYFGIEFKPEIYKDHGDDGTDLYLEGYGFIQIKTTTYKKDSWLRVEVNKKRDKVKSYLCCYVSKDNYETEIVGWADKETVECAEQRRCKRNGPMNFIMKESELKPIQEFNLCRHD